MRLHYRKGLHWTAGRKCECLDHICAPLHIASHFLTNPQNFTSVQAGDLRRRLKIIMEKFRTSAIIVTLHLFKQAIWEDMCNVTFGKISHMQLMWLFICWSSRFEKTFDNWYLRKSHTCNYCDFVSVQEGNMRCMKNHIKENPTTANKFALHAFLKNCPLEGKFEDGNSEFFLLQNFPPHYLLVWITLDFVT